jgi:Holliday junction resolvase RusA-like endonuclease
MTDWGEYHCAGINPVPWQTGVPFVVRSKGRVFAKMAPAGKLVDYQEAFREEFMQQQDHIVMHTGELEVQFHFWRNRSGRDSHADVSNLQKATEDVLQGILYNNDKSNRHVTGHLVEEGPKVKPYVIVRIREYVPGTIYIPAQREYNAGVRSDNRHGDGDDAF